MVSLDSNFDPAAQIWYIDHLRHSIIDDLDVTTLAHVLVLDRTTFSETVDLLYRELEYTDWLKIAQFADTNSSQPRHELYLSFVRVVNLDQSRRLGFPSWPAPRGDDLETLRRRLPHLECLRTPSRVIRFKPSSPVALPEDPPSPDPAPISRDKSRAVDSPDIDQSKVNVEVVSYHTHETRYAPWCMIDLSWAPKCWNIIEVWHDVTITTIPDPSVPFALNRLVYLPPGRVPPRLESIVVALEEPMPVCTLIGWLGKSGLLDKVHRVELRSRMSSQGSDIEMLLAQCSNLRRLKLYDPSAEDEHARPTLHELLSAIIFTPA